MEKIVETFNKLNLKAQNIDETLKVLKIRSKLTPEIENLQSETNEIKQLRISIQNNLKFNNDEIIRQYKSTTSGISRVQMKMMYLLQHLEELTKHQENEKRVLKEIQLPGTPKLFDRAGAIQAFSESNTPRMGLADYAKSPFAKKRSKMQLQFTDFEAEINNEDFSKIPGYMKGRTTLCELQEFLDTVVIRALNEKYQILFKQRASLKPSEFNLQSMFRDQASYFEGHKFVTVGDLCRVLDKNVDKRDDRNLQMLRHLHIIREARKNSIVCYIWLRK